jgi:hypothetical protein
MGGCWGLRAAAGGQWVERRPSHLLALANSNTRAYATCRELRQYGTGGVRAPWRLQGNSQINYRSFLESLTRTPLRTRGPARFFPARSPPATFGVATQTNGCAPAAYTRVPGSLALIASRGWRLKIKLRNWRRPGGHPQIVGGGWLVVAALFRGLRAGSGPPAPGPRMAGGARAPLARPVVRRAASVSAGPFSRTLPQGRRCSGSDHSEMDNTSGPLPRLHLLPPHPGRAVQQSSHCAGAAAIPRRRPA